MGCKPVDLTAYGSLRGYVLAEPGKWRVHERFPSREELLQPITRQPHATALGILLEMPGTNPTEVADA